MEGFFSGRHAGWTRGHILKKMYDLQADVVGASLWENIYCRYLHILMAGAVAAMGVGVGYLLGSSDAEQYSAASLSAKTWMISVGIGGFILGVALGVGALALILFNKVYIPFMIFQYADPKIPTVPTERIIGNCPRLAMFAEKDHYYFGVQGGGVMTASHIRFYSRPVIERNNDPTPDMSSNPATNIYSLPSHLFYSNETQGKAQVAMLKALEAAAIARPRSAKLKSRDWMSRENAAVAIFTIAGIVAIVLYMSGAAPSEIREAANVEEPPSSRPPANTPAPVSYTHLTLPTIYSV